MTEGECRFGNFAGPGTYPRHGLIDERPLAPSDPAVDVIRAAGNENPRLPWHAAPPPDHTRREDCYTID